MRRPLIRIALVGALILANPVSARADGTVLLGLMTLDGPRPSVGVAFGYAHPSPVSRSSISAHWVESLRIIPPPAGSLGTSSCNR